MSRSTHRMLILMLFGFSMACSRGDDTWTKGPAPSHEPKPSGKGVCALLMQGEVDELFGASVGAGAEEALADGSHICSWPSGEDPSLLLQVGSAASDIRGAIDLGEGYRVDELPGMSGPAAVAMETGDSGETVAILGMNVGEKSIILSPIGLGLQQDSPRFERLKELFGLMAQRM